VKVGVSLPTYGAFPGGAAAFLARAADLADAGAVETLWVADHLSLPEEDVRANGGRAHVDEPLDAWVCLATLAARSSRVRVGTEVTPLPLRNPVLLAQTVASLDVLSGGRAVLGLGLGWYRDEFRDAGVRFSPYAERLACTREQAGRLRGLLDGEPPLLNRRAEGHVPLFFGGRSENVLRLVAELGDGWIAATNASPDEVAAGRDRLHALLAEHGRDPAEVTIAVPFVARVADTTERARADLEAYIERGAFTGFVAEFLGEASRRYGIWGSPADCARKLEPYRELGVGQAILDVRPPDHALDSLERICQDLVPLLA
jgi:alkanesulfonate monooxygenase SsuD/methylene tetrahydromethanopterin reductase-like flavin-dependent oxidoreductase (luciferase family)